jgi:hypothetical protein
MTYSPLTDPLRQWDPYAACPKCGWTAEYNACRCDEGPTLPLIPSARSWENGTATLPRWSDEQRCWVSEASPGRVLHEAAPVAKKSRDEP